MGRGSTHCGGFGVNAAKMDGVGGLGFEPDPVFEY